MTAGPPARENAVRDRSPAGEIAVAAEAHSIPSGGIQALDGRSILLHYLARLLVHHKATLGEDGGESLEGDIQGVERRRVLRHETLWKLAQRIRLAALRNLVVLLH